MDRGLVSSVALVVPSLPIWSLPAYELALMTANRAAAQGREVTVLLITPEDAPLAALGVNASAEVGRLLSKAGVTTITSANCQIREPGKIDLSRCGDRSASTGSSLCPSSMRRGPGRPDQR